MAPRAAVAAARVVTLVLLTGAARAQNDPRPVGHFCPLYHPITSYGPAYVLDPSGPLRDEAGLWHLWEDRGA